MVGRARERERGTIINFFITDNRIKIHRKKTSMGQERARERERERRAKRRERERCGEERGREKEEEEEGGEKKNSLDIT